EIAKAVDETYTSLTGKFTVVKGEDTEDSYPEEVMEVLRTLKEGEVGQELIETEDGYYIVRLDKELDEEATEAKRELLKDSK
ncbi:peptidyl-prolyl cis-trans isomerase, partial [Acinetobacter baumannii]|nr:peptidyl-prolyl cis-trans isomerase [Acinetobacter baumannii]